MTPRCVCVPWLYGKPAFPSTPPQSWEETAGLCCCGVRVLCSSLCTSVFQCLQASCGFNLISLLKTIEPARHPVFFSQNIGDTFLVLWLQGARGVCLTPLDGVDGGDHCKITSAWSSAVFLPFPRQKQSNSLPLLLTRSSSESLQEVGKEQVTVLRFQENTGLLNIPEPLVGKPGTVC